MREIIPNLVSTVIPSYNRPRMLLEAVESVLAQTYRPIEVVIADDGSTDDTPHVGQSLADANPGVVFFHRKANTGPGPTRELGRQHARGEFIQYLDSDDLLRPRKFELQVTALKKNPECGASYGWICVHKRGQPPGTMPYKASGEVRETLFPWILSDRWWNTDAPLFRRSVTDAIGPWSDLRWSQDWEMDGRVGALGTRLVHVADWVCDERHHDTGRQTDPVDWSKDEKRLKSRRRFLEMMHGHAVDASVPASNPSRMHFTRWVFATARQCAAIGLTDDAKSLLQLAWVAAGDCTASRKGMTAFYCLSRTLGLENAGRLASWLQRIRRPGKLTLKESAAQDKSASSI